MIVLITDWSGGWPDHPLQPRFDDGVEVSAQGRGVNRGEVPPAGDQFGRTSTCSRQRTQLCDRPSVPGHDQVFAVLDPVKHLTNSFAKVLEADLLHTDSVVVVNDADS